MFYPTDGNGQFKVVLAAGLEFLFFFLNVVNSN